MIYLYHCAVKSQWDRKNSGSLLSLLGFVILLLISPCAVRNYIQSEIGIPQTEVSNKSKATIHTSQCSIQEITDIAQTTYEESTFSFTALAATKSSFTIRWIVNNEKSIDHYFERNHFISFLPLYILYQNFKVHS
ncbi:MAG: hypothetical protein ACSHXL_04830 [Bacteroidota bacterium]